MPETTDPVALLPERYRPLILPCLTLTEVPYESVRTIFQNCRVYLKEIPDFYDCVRRVGLGHGGQKDRYTYCEALTFYAEQRYAILMKATEEEFLKAVQISDAKKKSSQYVQFLANVLAARDGRPVKRLPAFSSPWRESEFWEDLQPDIRWISVGSNNPLLLKAVPEKALIKTLRDSQNNLSHIATSFNNLAAVQSVLQNSTLPELSPNRLHDFLELQFGFVTHGVPVQRMAAMQSQSSEYFVMQAVAQLSAGQDAEALKSMRNALKLQERSERFFNTPLENLLYGLTLWRCRRMPTAMKSVEALAKHKKIGWFVCLPLRLFILYTLQQDLRPLIAGATEALEGIPPRGVGLTVLLIKALKIQCELPDLWLASYEMCRKDMLWFAYEAAALESRSGPGFEEARKKLAVEPLMPLIVPRPEWETRLEHLIELQDQDSDKMQTKRAEQEVLSFLINPASCEVVPRVRRTKDGEHFSLGRMVAIDSLARGRIPEASERDRAVGTMAETVWTPFTGNVKRLKGPAIVRELIGHPYLFDATRPD
ncbi:MAG: hypothetical protein ACI4SV_05005, partial [Duodenibacillus sp.]